MNVLIAGGTGFLGSALAGSLLSDGHHVWILTRNPLRARLPAGAQAVAWDGRTVGAWVDVFSTMDAVVNLVGENVGQWPWTAERKRRILLSRVEAGFALAEAFQKSARRPAVLLQASGIGYYGPRGSEPVDENSQPGTDFFSSVAIDWEASTRVVDTLGVRRVIIRTALVLDARGGILPLMALPVKLFAGGPLGNGRQGVSWIHLEDHIRAMRFLLENAKAFGAFNLTAPNPLSNAEFISALAKSLKRPCWLPAPAFALRAVLGEMSTLLLDGQFVLPRRLVDMGFVFKYQTAVEALQAIFGA
ncbi:MAG: TIGR01777 family protein [Anaerolineae bacterium]|nr:MAG: TIGR01777 family protein [Anaerolineae bacterium]